MNFKLGFITGTVAGYSLARFLTDGQKKALEERLNETGAGQRLGKVTGTLRRSTAEVADSVVDRATGAVEATAERATSALGSETSNGTAFGEADRAPTPAESAAADKAAESAPDVGDTYDEMARRGAETAGEGRVP